MDDSVFLLISLLTQIFFKIYKESSSALTPTVTKKRKKKRELRVTLGLLLRAGWRRPAGPSTKELDEAGVAVGFVLLLLEAAFAQRLQAEVTHEVMWVEFGPHCGDAAPQDGLLAGLTHAAAGLVVVGLAQRLALVLEKAAVDEGAVALLETRGSDTARPSHNADSCNSNYSVFM